MSDRGLRGYRRLFGSGPPGILATLVLFAVAKVAADRVPNGEIHGSSAVSLAAAVTFGLAALALAIASTTSLPPDQRGRGVCRTGAYRWFRHPLYASFLLGTLGLALYLDHWIYLAWAVLLHPIWHVLVRHEEGLMLETFGQPYADYARVTGRFVPRFWRPPRHDDPADP
ncbi:MAG: isoprenylcysteine carboxylmethyltransferase family protein [Acidobacteriota bacterium]